jgi:hypothetical protein
MRTTTMMPDGEKNGSEVGSVSYTASMLLYQLGHSGLTDSLTSSISCLLHSVREALLAVSPGFPSMLGCENFNQ